MRIIILLWCLLAPAFTSCSDDEGGTTPELTYGSQVLFEGDGDDIEFQVKGILSAPLPTSITVKYHTESQTAQPVIDYGEIVDGSIEFPEGTTEINIPVMITSDDHFEISERFKLIIDEIQGVNLSTTEIFVTINNDDDLDDPIMEDKEGFYTPVEYPSMSLYWEESFESQELDQSIWNYEIGDGCPDLCGWGNNELEYYTDLPENVKLESGKLVITALKNEESPTYTSARLTTANKKNIQFGRIDIRAKLPKGQGIWPALWMLGANIDDVSWPQCGEIDIMEMVGHEANTVHGTVHFQGSNGYEFTGNGYLKTGGDFDEKFHVFSMVWDRDNIRWYVDYQLFFQVSKTSLSGYPFNQEFFFLVNMAIGGNWPGSPDQTTVFPQTFEVDYIRVFQ